MELLDELWQVELESALGACDEDEEELEQRQPVRVGLDVRAEQSR